MSDTYQGHVSVTDARTGMKLGHANAQNEVVSAPLIVDMGQRLSGLGEELASARADLSMLRDRLFGMEPPSPTATGASPKPQGQSSELLSQLNDLRSLSLDISALARVLNGRI